MHRRPNATVFMKGRTKRAAGVQLDWHAIASEVPDLAIRSAMRLGEGWTAEAFLVNDALVFKFPKRADEWKELDREIAFLAYARPLLPVPVAEHLFQVRVSSGAPHGYAVYRHLRGKAALAGARSGQARSMLAATLAGFLRTLHGLMPVPAIAPVLLHENERDVAEMYVRDAQDTIAPQLPDADRRSLHAVFTRYLDDPANFPITPRVLHADLSAGHILWGDGAVTGVLDWGDVNLGDPDYDFSYLSADFGDEFVREVAREYGHSDPDRLIRKAHYFRVVDQIGTIVHGGDRALPGQEAAAWRQLRALLHT
jgi:aminoglycoside 2''-phosphotransferase